MVDGAIQVVRWFHDVIHHVAEKLHVGTKLIRRLASRAFRQLAHDED